MGTEDRFKTFWLRFGAAIVDALVLTPVWLIGEATREAIGQAASVILVDGALYSALPLFYSVLLHAKYGKTVGKMAFGVTVVDISETRGLLLRQAVLRDIGYIVLSTLGFLALLMLLLGGDASVEAQMNSSVVRVLSYAGTIWAFLEIVSMLTNPKRRAVHDFIAGTVVVRDATSH